MSFSINGETWEPKTTVQHADLIIDKINELLLDNNVQDADGNIVKLKKNYANALYLLALGDGQRLAENDAELSQAINSFNIELADDQQIQNLLPIAAMTRNPGSYSTLQLVATASEDGQCVIPAGTKAAFEDVNFVTQTDTIISAGSTAIINTVCDTLGPVVVLSGQITEFETEIANLESVTNPVSSVPGIAPETTNALRKRLLSGDTIKYSLDGCKRALEELTGISHARVYFNYNTSEDMTLPGNVDLTPRTAYIVVQGSSDKIAETYAQLMNAPTQNDENATGDYSTLNVKVTTTADGSATLPNDTTVTYEGHTFLIDAETTIGPSTTSTVGFTCTEVGPYEVPVLGVTHLDQTITNVSSAQNLEPAVPGYGDPKHSQNWVTSSGQSIEIKYDDAKMQTIYIKVYLEKNATVGDQITNQIKRDLILASASWQIGETMTQVLSCAPFVNCSYTDVAYTKLSNNGVDWYDTIELGCNEIPRVVDASISVEQISEA